MRLAEAKQCASSLLSVSHLRTRWAHVEALEVSRVAPISRSSHVLMASTSIRKMQNEFVKQDGLIWKQGAVLDCTPVSKSKSHQLISSIEAKNARQTQTAQPTTPVSLPSVSVGLMGRNYVEYIPGIQSGKM